MRRALLPFVVVIAATASACSAEEPGRPTPGSGSGSSEQTTTTSPSEPGAEPVGFPPRPKDLPLTGLDPCKLITAAQRTELKVVRADSSDYEGQPECAFTVEGGEPYLDISVLLDSREGADAWLTEERNVDAEPVTVGGYGAAHFWLASAAGAGCDTAVDVADGQHLRVGLLLPGKGWTQEKLCETTDRFAAAALTTLRTG